MTALESNAVPLSPEMPDTLSTQDIDRMIMATLGVSFRFLTRVEKALPRSYGPRPRPSGCVAGISDPEHCDHANINGLLPRDYS